MVGVECGVEWWDYNVGVNGWCRMWMLNGGC